ncbi:MAG TPA: NAD(P)/FAD-dependent oxidoreductase [Thermoanaerobaculia bacterium]|nr:NAD(P)/FAD-dependent oxidoreductase [Thermoanaerobaculia bacterium]
MAEPRVVIVGSGFAGLAAARALRRVAIRLTVVDRRNHHLFQPLLYQVASAALSPGDIAYPIRAILARQKNTEVLLANAVSIDTASRQLVLSDGRLPYDFLIVATGARHAYFGHDEWERFAPGLKSLEDALEIRRRILLAFERAERETDPERRRNLLTFVVVGAGPTGVELSAAIAEISREVLVEDFRAIDPREARIVLVEAGPRVLPSYSEESSRHALEGLRRKGVEVRLGAAVKAIDAAGVQVEGERLAAGTVLWAAGVAASPLARSLGVPLDRAGRVLVQPDLTIPGHPEVFVVGDLAAFLHQGGSLLPGTSPVAIQEGRRAAENVRSAVEGKPAGTFRYRDRGTMAVIGRASAVAEILGLHFSGIVAWLVWCFVHIFFLIGFRNRFVVMFEWAWAYVSHQRGARLITGRIEESRQSEGGSP